MRGLYVLATGILEIKTMFLLKYLRFLFLTFITAKKIVFRIIVVCFQNFTNTVKNLASE